MDMDTPLITILHLHKNILHAPVHSLFIKKFLFSLIFFLIFSFKKKNTLHGAYISPIKRLTKQPIIPSRYNKTSTNCNEIKIENRVFLIWEVRGT